MLLNSFEKLHEHLDLMLSKLKIDDCTKFLEKVNLFIFKVNFKFRNQKLKNPL